MRRLILLSIACLSLLATGCAKSSGSSNSTSGSDASAAGTGGDISSKSIFSVWNEENNSFQLDFRSAQFGVTSYVYVTSRTVGSCSCQVVIQGSESAGTMAISNCNNGSVSCVTLLSSGPYKKTSSGLQICPTNAGCMSME